MPSSHSPADEKRAPELSLQPPFELDHWRVEPARLTVRSCLGGEQRLEPRVMALLIALTQARPQVISRHELLDTVWADVSVGDKALTMAISKLRHALGTRRDGSPFIETIPRVGYRVTVKISTEKVVGFVANGEKETALPAEDASTLAPTERPCHALGRPGRDYRSPRGRPARCVALAVLSAAIAVILANAGWLFGARSPAATPTATEPPVAQGLTADRGLESQSSLDPTARRLAFQSHNEGGPGLSLMDLETRRTVMLVDGWIHSPAWSPIDQRIAFIRRGEELSTLSMVAADGGPVEDLLEIEPSPLVGIGWSPDGSRLAWSGRSSESAAYVIKELELDSGRVRLWTDPIEGKLGDGRPTYSPDGRWIAFTRGRRSHLHSYDLWLIDRATRQEHRLTHDEERIWGFDWLPDSSGLILSSNRSGRFQLWSIRLSNPGLMTWIPTAGDQVRFPNVRGGILVYDAFQVPSDLFLLTAHGAVHQLDRVNSNGRESAAAFSPDGRRLAYASDHGGPGEVWIREQDGRSRLVSRLESSQINRLAWSPCASRLAAIYIRQGRESISLVEIGSGDTSSAPLPPGRVSDGPVFSPDGRSLFVSAKASGSFEIWEIGLSPGGAPAKVTELESLGGALAIRFDRAGTAFVLTGQGTLLRRDRGRGWITVLRRFLPLAPFAWTVLEEEVHALRRGEKGEVVWQRWDLDGVEPISLATVSPRLENGGFTVHPSGRSAVYGRLLPMESDLRLMRLPVVVDL